MTTNNAPGSGDNTERLPCRGCTSECPNYAKCGGKPWRQSIRVA